MIYWFTLKLWSYVKSYIMFAFVIRNYDQQLFIVNYKGEKTAGHRRNGDGCIKELTCAHISYSIFYQTSSRICLLNEPLVFAYIVLDEFDISLLR